jgi:hypothetical protein
MAIPQFADDFREFLKLLNSNGVEYIGEIPVPVISLVRLRDNKRAAGRAKDLADLDNLPE